MSSCFDLSVKKTCKFNDFSPNKDMVAKFCVILHPFKISKTPQ